MRNQTSFWLGKQEDFLEEAFRQALKAGQGSSSSQFVQLVMVKSGGPRSGEAPHGVATSPGCRQTSHSSP